MCHNACEILTAALIPVLTVQTHLNRYKIAAGKVFRSEQVSQQESHQDLKPKETNGTQLLLKL